MMEFSHSMVLLVLTLGNTTEWMSDLNEGSIDHIDDHDNNAYLEMGACANGEDEDESGESTTFPTQTVRTRRRVVRALHFLRKR